MPTPRLSKEQLAQAKVLFEELRDRINGLSGGEPGAVFAFRRRLRKWLEYEERGTPMERRHLKELMWKRQRGICALCQKELPETETELDRLDAVLGYREGNVRLVHHECHRNDQRQKGFK